MPLDVGASGTLTRSRLVHPIVSRETPSKREKEAWRESRDEAGIVEPRRTGSVVEAGIEESAVKAEIEVVAEAGIESAVEAGIEPASETRQNPDRSALARPSHVLGLKLAGRPQR
jgi:hypothetical protein